MFLCSWKWMHNILCIKEIKASFWMWVWYNKQVDGMRMDNVRPQNQQSSKMGQLYYTTIDIYLYLYKMSAKPCFFDYMLVWLVEEMSRNYQYDFAPVVKCRHRCHNIFLTDSAEKLSELVLDAFSVAFIFFFIRARSHLCESPGQRR